LSGDSNANNDAGGTAKDNKNDEEDNLVITRLHSQVIPLQITSTVFVASDENHLPAPKISMCQLMGHFIDTCPSFYVLWQFSN
jgi:hypothetical protein